MASYGRSSLPLLSAVHANRHPKATSMAFSGRPSLPFASPKTLTTPKTLKTLKTPKKPKKPKTLKTVKTLPKQGQIHRFFWAMQELPQGQIHRFFWAVQELPQGQILRLPFAKPSQPTGTPRPHQWLLMGVQACRLPAPKRLKRLKPLKSLKSLKRLKPLKLAKAFGNA